jgi:hypothetical protein
VLNYNTPPSNPQLEEWLKAVGKDGLQPYITLRECESQTGFPACPPKAPSTTVYRREITKLMKGLTHGHSEAGIPPVSIWGAWNEPDNGHDPLHSIPSGAREAAHFWQVMQKTAKEVGCHCTVVAGEFTEYNRRYFEAYRKTILKGQIYWHGKPHMWGLHDYRDLKYLHLEHRNTDAIAFEKVTKTNLGHPHIWLSELGVELQDNDKWTSLVGRPKLQREAAEDFLRIGSARPRIDREYYYLYVGPTKAAIEKHKPKHQFDSALLPGEELTKEDGHNTEDPRPAYCVLALGTKGCRAKAATLSLVSGTIDTTAGQALLTVDPGGLASTFWVEYGTTTAYGHSTPAVSPASEEGLQSESASIEGLEPCTTYHYQAKAENEANEGIASLGGDRTFTTRCEVGIFLAREGTGSPAEIWEVDPAGSMPHAVGPAPEGSDPSLSPDRQSIAYSVYNGFLSPPEVRIRPLAGGTPTTVYSYSPGEATIGEPTWSPDGTKLIFAVRIFSGATHIAIDSVDTDGSDPKTLVTIAGGSGIFQFPSYSPDGSNILFIGPASGSGLPEIDVANADGSDVKAVTSSTTVIPEEHPRFSPDGTKIAFSGSLPESVSPEYNQRIYTVNADGSGLTELTHGFSEANDEWAFEPEWTPDGSKIIYPYEFSEGGLKKYELYVVNADGSDEGQPFLAPLTGVTETWGMSFAP